VGLEQQILSICFDVTVYFGARNRCLSTYYKEWVCEGCLETMSSDALLCCFKFTDLFVVRDGNWKHMFRFEVITEFFQITRFCVITYTHIE